MDPPACPAPLRGASLKLIQAGAIQFEGQLRVHGSEAAAQGVRDQQRRTERIV
jgi:hypothetical protein